MVYLGNLFGSIIYAFLFWISITNFGHTYDSAGATAIVRGADGKTLHYAQFGIDETITVLTKAMLGNWMVTMAVVLGFTSTSVGGKIIGGWLPILIFLLRDTNMQS